MEDYAKLILYLCPTGELGDQLDAYFAQIRTGYGPNAAHEYMPHVSLTGFFHDLPMQIPFYTLQLDRIISDLLATEVKPDVTLKRLGFDNGFHGIELESRWLSGLVDEFMACAISDSRLDAIRKKDWLHLSLAYKFPTEQQTPLRTLAEDLVHLDAPVVWEIRFYERHPDLSWTCHKAWSIVEIA